MTAMTSATPDPAPTGYFPAPPPVAPYRPYPGPRPEVSLLTQALEPAAPGAVPGVATATLAIPTTGSGLTPALSLAGPTAPPVPLGLAQAVRLMLARATDFSGRASRSEFWLATLAIGLAYVLWFVALIWAGLTHALGYHLIDLLGVAGTAGALLLALPHSALTVRRLHDSGHSGALWFLHLIPGFGTLGLAGFCAEPSSPRANRRPPTGS